MRLWFCTAACVALMWGAADSTAPNTLTADEKAAGWQLLFDGKTMNGWEDPRRMSPPGDAWTIEDGCLKAVPHPRIDEDLLSKETFRDFELQWEWRISPAGNSGLKYRIQRHGFIPPKPAGAGNENFEASVQRMVTSPMSQRPNHGQDYVIGFEYQMIDDTANGDRLNPKQTSGALYDMIAPSSHNTLRVGEFNRSRLVVRGKHVEHWMNGVKVVDSSLDAPEALAGIRGRWGEGTPVFDLLAKQPVKVCPISLQNHGDAAWFRSIKVRRLQ